MTVIFRTIENEKSQEIKGNLSIVSISVTEQV